VNVHWSVTGFSLPLGHTLQQSFGSFNLNDSNAERKPKSATRSLKRRYWFTATCVVSISSVEDDIVLGRLFFQEIQIGQTTMQALDMVPQFVEKCHFLIGTSESCDRVLVFVF
jgi:hypothetical protein